jgi:hypothetical protein
MRLWRIKPENAGERDKAQERVQMGVTRRLPCQRKKQHLASQTSSPSFAKNPGQTLPVRNAKRPRYNPITLEERITQSQKGCPRSEKKKGPAEVVEQPEANSSGIAKSSAQEEKSNRPKGPRGLQHMLIKNITNVHVLRRHSMTCFQPSEKKEPQNQPIAVQKKRKRKALESMRREI